MLISLPLCVAIELLRADSTSFRLLGSWFLTMAGSLTLAGTCLESFLRNGNHGFVDFGFATSRSPNNASSWTPYTASFASCDVACFAGNTMLWCCSFLRCFGVNSIELGCDVDNPSSLDIDLKLPRSFDPICLNLPRVRLQKPMNDMVELSKE
ncbi:hypothetical protein BOVATA_025420 [Babesia ovata]|uniref:Uncharacterized protein n=1 Tax=Babesia ovata TaxID=189622 RepID=A0A2H6KDL6_9APIC|nr:uncharacterized protein BOVATA_025420 [Babesia ovata]GBE61049.1 hypothetical protein BOVATA_025420 [Babesia ovata]